MRKTIKNTAAHAAADADSTQPAAETNPVQEAASEMAPEAAELAQPEAKVGNTVLVATHTSDVENLGVGRWTPGMDWGFLDPSRSAPAPAFPIEELPPDLAQLIGQFAVARRLPVDYVAFAVLAALSGAIGNRVRVLLFDGTLEVLSIFVALVGAPATGKSLAIGIAEPLLRKLESQLSASVSSVAMAVGQAALDRLNIKMRAKVAERLAVEFESPNDVIDQPTGRLLLSEATGPGLIEELGADQMGRMFVTHELPATIGYLVSSQSASSRGRFLQTYDGGPLTVASKSEGRKVVPAMVLTVLGAVQPRRLPYLMHGPDDGFASRFFWIYPDVEPIASLSEDPGPIDVLTALLSALQAIKPARDEQGYSARVPLAAEARAPLEVASEKWATHQQFSDERSASALGRGRQYAIRVAAILEIAAHVLAGSPGLPEAVRIDSVERAINIVDGYLLPMSERAFTVGHASQSNAAALARYLVRLGKPVVNARADVMRGRGSPVTKPLLVREAIEELEQRGVLKPVPPRPGRGRPSSDWIVHPDLLAMLRK